MMMCRQLGLASLCEVPGLAGRQPSCVPRIQRAPAAAWEDSIVRPLLFAWSHFMCNCVTVEIPSAHACLEHYGHKPISALACALQHFLVTTTDLLKLDRHKMRTEVLEVAFTRLATSAKHMCAPA